MKKHERTASISRRGFLQAGTAFAASFAVAQGLAGCAPQGHSDETAAATTTEAEGTWQPLGCATGCCNNCVNYGLVVDGKVVSQKTDDLHEDSFDMPQVRSCVKGRALRYKFQGDDRLNFPMKRKNWMPGGDENVNGHLRGQDEWERISWDAAIEYTATELERIKNEYGNEAFLAPSLVDERAGLMAGYLLNAYGGCTTCWGSTSAGTWPLTANLMQGQYNLDNNDRYSLQKAQLIVLWGYNPAWTWPKVAWELSQAKQAGARIIMVDPWFTPSAQSLASDWIPVRPGTDGALLLAIACYMIENDLHDQAFLDTYTLGFDAEHMPEGVAAEENFSDYVLGTYDGVKKDAAWASPLCGTPIATIESFAHDLATIKPATIRASMAPSRTDNGFSFSRLFMTIGWMTGNVGTEGAEVAAGTYVFGGYMGLGDHGLSVPQNPICTPPLSGGQLWANLYDEEQYYGVALSEAWEAVLTGKYHAMTHGVRDIDIRCIYGIGYGAPLNNLPNVSKGIEAFRSVDFVVTSDLFMTTDCCYSDIVLPAASTWERPWSSVMRTSATSSDASGDSLAFGHQVCEAPYDRKTDLWMEVEIGKKLGIDEADIQDISWDQMNFNKLASATTAIDGGEDAGPICTITQEDLDEFGVEGEVQEGKIPLKQLLEDGQYKLERSEDTYRQIGHQAFIADPAANPLETASGKMEIHCQTLSDALAVFGTPQATGIPTYQAAERGYEASFTDWESKTRGEYDLQLLTVHYIAHQLSQMSNVKELNEYWPNALLMNPATATQRGLEPGDTALIESEYGKVLRRVATTPCLMPGVVVIGQGNWANMGEDGIDRGGNGNVLCGDRLVGFGQVPWNTNLVKVSAWDGEEMTPDYAEPRMIVDIEEA